jgi:hypothetical protein
MVKHEQEIEAQSQKCRQGGQGMNDISPIFKMDQADVLVDPGSNRIGWSSGH